MEHFSEVPDPREDNSSHPLTDIIAIAICASICGANGWSDMEEFGHAKRGWFERFLELPHGIPSSDTFRRVFARIDPAVLNERFSSWCAHLRPPVEREVVSIDGKSARRSHDSARGQTALHTVSAWAHEAGLVLGRRAVEEKSNEITAIPELLDMLELSGCVVTIDAMGTQTDIAERIVDADADYVLALKDNHPTLCEEVSEYFEGIEEQTELPEHIDYARSVETDHGRTEVRECWATGDIGWLESKSEWKNIRSICVIRNERSIGEETSEQIRYFISSLEPDAHRLAHAVRSHWAIENSLHWVLDIAFREDECRKRTDHSAENFSILRHLTLNMLKRETTSKRSIRRKRLRAGWDEAYLEGVLRS
jgi:predicted transposase YbfD/YdcC